MEKIKVFFQNLKSVHHRIMANYLRKRNWVVFYMHPENRKCPNGTCLLKLYEETKTRN